MKKLVSITGSAALFAALLTGCMLPMGCHGGGHETATAPAAQEKPANPAPTKAQEVWVCPMNEYTSNAPGKCPKCGMELVRKQ